jgi:hypothetical protein
MKKINYETIETLLPELVAVKVQAQTGKIITRNGAVFYVEKNNYYLLFDGKYKLMYKTPEQSVFR